MYEKKNMTYKISKISMLDIEYLSAEGDYYSEHEKYHENPIDYFLNEMNN